MGKRSDIKELVKAGVDGLLKGATFDDFLKAIRSAAEREKITAEDAEVMENDERKN